MDSCHAYPVLCPMGWYLIQKIQEDGTITYECPFPDRKFCLAIGQNKTKVNNGKEQNNGKTCSNKIL